MPQVHTLSLKYCLNVQGNQRLTLMITQFSLARYRHPTIVDSNQGPTGYLSRLSNDERSFIRSATQAYTPMGKCIITRS